MPRVFLTGAGLSDEFIDKVLTVAAVTRPVQMNSVFISYSSADEEFATRLHAKLRENDVRVWFAPKDMMPGRQIHEQIDEAIQLHDRLMLVLSRESLASNWVTTELRKAIHREKRERRRVIFPIRLAQFSDLQTWECFDADLGSDLAVAVREYFVPDFSEWRSSAKFDVAVQQLLQALRNSSSKAG